MGLISSYRYPKELAWQANFDNEQMKESELRSLMNFLFEETSGVGIRLNYYENLPFKYSFFFLN